MGCGPTGGSGEGRAQAEFWLLLQRPQDLSRRDRVPTLLPEHLALYVPLGRQSYLYLCSGEAAQAQTHAQLQGLAKHTH